MSLSVNFKRHLIGYAWVIALRELRRIPRIPAEIRRGSVILAGLLTSPFVISAFAWWVLTAKRLPGPVGAWLHDPGVVRVNNPGIASLSVALDGGRAAPRSSHRSGSRISQIPIDHRTR